MPHVTIKHFPADVTPEKAEALSATLTEALVRALGCRPNAISIDLRAVAPEDWDEQVYQPEIAGRTDLLKTPNY